MTAISFLGSVLITLALVVSDSESSANKKSQNRYMDFQDFDAVLVSRCDVICNSLVASRREQCHGKCLVRKTVKPGTCPQSFDGLSDFAQACLKVCDYDGECPGIEKCCQHSCGVTCQPANDLQLHRPPLPPIPTQVMAKQSRRSNSVEISWSYPISASNASLLFLIEFRSHFGQSFSFESLGPWTALYESKETPTIITGLLQAAHWYIFRVAAINAEGTQGYSSSSKPWTLIKAPNKPGQPRRLGVTNAREINGTVWADLRWTKPKTTVPIKRYKVFWSRRLPAHHRSNASDSVLVHQRTVSQVITIPFQQIKKPMIKMIVVLIDTGETNRQYKKIKK